MSASVRSKTPFINKEYLLKALERIGVNYTLQGDFIVTDRIDYKGAQKFFLQGRNYVLEHDSDNYFIKNSPQLKTAKSFLNALEVEYKKEQQRVEEEIRQRKLEMERIRQEELERIRQEELRKKQEQLQDTQRKRMEEERLAQTSYKEREKKLAEKIKQLEEKAKQEELQKYIESQKEQIYKKAQEAGYKVKEMQKGEKIQLVLVRRS